MKKQIKDLRLGDTIYKFNGTYKPEEYEIISISKDELRFVGNTFGSIYKFKMVPGDLTRWEFEDSSWNYKFYLERMDALKERRKALDLHLEGLFEKQNDFLDLVQEANNKIRKCDIDIFEEMKSTI